MNDLRFAFRQLFKNPAFTLIAVCTLAIGIGACSAIFSVVNNVLLRPLDYPNADRLVILREAQPPQFPEFSTAPANYVDWTKQAKSFEQIAAIGGAQMNLTGEGEPQRLIGVRATANYFDVYGIKPLLGRWFSAEEDAPGKNHVVVLSQPFWKRVFGGAANVIDKQVQLNGEPYTIVGVAPAGFGQEKKNDVWTPMAFKPDETSNDARGAHYVSTLGLLRPGVTVGQADAEMRVIAAQLAAQYPKSNKGWTVFVMSLLEYNTRNVRVVLYTLLGAVGCVLLIACANIANLLLARATSRHREISIRAALGAGRARLVRQLLTESVLLALLGGIAGLILAHWGLAALLALAPATLPRTSSIHLDGTVVAFSVGLSLLTGIIFGAAPAWLAAHTDVNEALKQGARGSTEGGARGRFRSVLVILEVAFALVLLGGAGLLMRSFMALTHVDPGFVPENATVLRLALPEKKYPKPEQQKAFVDSLLQQLSALPGVQAVGATQIMPLVGDYSLSFEIEGRPLPESDWPSTTYYSVTPEYFRAMGIRLIRGRTFTAQDDGQAPRVAIINETLARQFFPNEDPIGKRINIPNDAPGSPKVWREIIGIVADVKQFGVARETTSQSYEPFAQSPFDDFNVVLRTSGSPAAMLSALRPAVYAVDKDQPIGSIRPLEELMAENISQQRFAMLLLTIFSGVALVIAAVGIYGVMAYSVSQRTNEIGIRMALGAHRGDVLRLVLKQGGKLVGLGLAVGLVATLATSRALRSILYNTSAQDPLILISTMILLAAIALVACLLPARRASMVDPIQALRTE